VVTFLYNQVANSCCHELQHLWKASPWKYKWHKVWAKHKMLFCNYSL